MKNRLPSDMPRVGFREINRLAVPAILAGIAEPLISLTDLAIIGKVPLNPTEALAAVGIAGSFLSALIWVLAQTKTAISAIVARYLGAGKTARLKTFVTQALVFNLLLSAGLVALTWALAAWIFKQYQAEGLLLEYAVDYFRIRVLGFPFTLITFAIFGVLRGLQNTSWAMFISVGGGTINILLDLVLVYGIKDYIPPLHIQGAAWASLIAQGLMMAAALVLLYRKTDFRLVPLRGMHPELKPMIVMSLNLFIRTAALNFAIYLANRYATGYGNAVIAAQSVLMNIWLFSAFFIDGYANAGNAISGRLLGSRAYRELWSLGMDLCRIAIVAALLLMLAYFISYDHLGRFFISDAQTLSVFKQAFWLVILMQPVNAVAFTFDGIFKGLGEAGYLRNLLITATFAGFVPVIWICDRAGLSFYSIWIAFFIWMGIRAGGLIIRFRKKYLSANIMSK